MPELKGSRTEQNLLKAFAGESQARNRYTFFAKVAAKEGYEQIAALFLETAERSLLRFWEVQAFHSQAPSRSAVAM